MKETTVWGLKENIEREIKIIPEDMLKRVIDNFNVRVAGVLSITRDSREKMDILQMPPPAKSFSGTWPLEKNLPENFINGGNMACQNCAVFCGPPCN